MSEKEMKDLEVRFFPGASDLKVEKRAADDSEVTYIEGYAALFDTLSLDLGGFREQIAPGAFKSSLENGNIRAFANHEGGLSQIGSTNAGSLEAREDDKGLFVRITPPPTQAGKDSLILVESGEISQMSFGFSVRSNGSSWGVDEEGAEIRTLTDVNLFEVSIVSFPAYPDTSIAARSLDSWRDNVTKSDKEIRDIAAAKARMSMEFGLLERGLNR